MALPGLAAQIGVGRIDYKHEGARFGLGSFKALGGAYAAMRVLQREVGARLGRTVSLEDIRKGVYAEACSQITLSSATDGNHGRSLAWGCGRVGAPCRIYIHSEVSAVRAEAMRDLGAEVVRIDGDYDESVNVAQNGGGEKWLVRGFGHILARLYRPPTRCHGRIRRYDPRSLRGTKHRTHPRIPTRRGRRAGGIGCRILASILGRQSPARHHSRTRTCPMPIRKRPPRHAHHGENPPRNHHGRSIMRRTFRNSMGNPARRGIRLHHHPDSLVAPTIRLLANAESGDEKIEAGESAVAGLATLIAVMQDAKLAHALGLDKSARILLFGSEGITDPAIFKAIMDGTDRI